MTTIRTKVAIYIRVGREEQTGQRNLIDTQIETLSNYCKMNGKDIFSVNVDEGFSGATIEGRYSLQRLLNDAEENMFNGVLVWKISALARRTIDFIDIVEKLEKESIKFRSYSEQFETSTPLGKLTIQLLSAFAELELNVSESVVEENTSYDY